MRGFRSIVVIGCASLLSMSSAYSESTESALRETVAKALPYIEERGDWWIERNNCVSCHRVSVMTWALSDARAHGFDVDFDSLQSLQRWSREALLAPRDDMQPKGVDNLEAVAQILWSERSLEGDDSVPAENASFVRFITDAQGEDGLWTAGGQLPDQKRPKEETALVSTMWIALALGTVKEHGSIEDAQDRLTKPVNTVDQAVSTEWYALRLLLAAENGSAEEISRWIHELRSLQQSDGGWGWITSEPSDALATGQAFYALRFAGISGDDAVIQKALQFLIRSQNDDGSWKVLGTKEARKDQPEETAAYWGTCWAVIALVSQLESPIVLPNE